MLQNSVSDCTVSQQRLGCGFCCQNCCSSLLPVHLCIKAEQVLWYYYKCHGLECYHHIVAGTLYENLDLNCCTAQCRRLLTIGVDGATSAVWLTKKVTTEQWAGTMKLVHKAGIMISCVSMCLSVCLQGYSQMHQWMWTKLGRHGMIL